MPDCDLSEYEATIWKLRHEHKQDTELAAWYDQNEGAHQ